MAAQYGFAAQTPKEAEGFVSIYHLNQLWQDFLASKTGTAFRTAPSIQQKLADPGLRKAIDEAKRRLGLQTLSPLMTDLFGNEIFVIFSQGSAQRLLALQQFSNQLRLENFKAHLANTLHTDKSPDKWTAILEIYKANTDSLQLPPLIFGSKISNQKTALIQQLDLLEKKLPAGVDIAAFNLNDKFPFKSLIFNASKLLTPALQDQFKQALAAEISDPKLVDYIFQSVMVRKIEIAYGFVGDYLIASIGNDHAHLKLASNFGTSLLARPELAVATQFVNKPILGLSWCDQSIVALRLPHSKISALYDNLKASIEPDLTGVDLKKLEADLARLDAKAAAIFPTEVDPCVSIVYRDHGICSETFGGMKLQGFANAAPLKFSSVPSDTTFLWMDAQKNPTLNAACWDWFEDFTSTGYHWFLTVGSPKIPDAQKMGFALFQNLAVPKLIDLFHITKDQFSKSLGNETALVVDLDGEMPRLPMMPEPLLKNGKMLRLGLIRDIRDRKLLTQSWESYFKIARDIAMMIPQTAKIPGGLSEPKFETEDGITFSYYPLPLSTGDLIPNIATTDRTFVMSSSRKYSIELTKATAKPLLPGANPIIIDLRIQTKAACDFLDQWIAVAIENPDILFPNQPKNAADFKLNQPNISLFIKAARSVSGIESKVFEEKGQPRVTTRIGWKE